MEKIGFECGLDGLSGVSLRLGSRYSLLVLISTSFKGQGGWGQGAIFPLFIRYGGSQLSFKESLGGGFLLDF